MNSYRESHIGTQRGEKYDARAAVRADALIWDTFVKPWVRTELRRAKDGGAAVYLDFACGTGRLLKVGQAIFGKSTGIDVSEDMLAVARTRVPDATLLRVDVTQSPSSDIGYFDCVTLFRFILNAEPALRADALRWLSQHTRHGAVLIVNNHCNAASYSGLLAKAAFWLPKNARNTLSRRQVFQMLGEAGFSVVRCEGFRVLPSVFGRPVLGRWLQAWGERVCKRLGLDRFGAELVVVAVRE